MVFALTSCSQDLFEEQIKTSKYKVNYVDSKELKKNARLIESLKKDKLIHTNSLGKIVNDTINKFSIDTDLVKYLQGENFDSYTFKILEEEENYLDNLVLMSQIDGNYLPYIMRYSLTEQDRQALITGSPIDFTNKGKVFLLNNYNIVNDVLGKYSYSEECAMVYTWEEMVTYSIDPNQCDCWGLNETSVSHVLVGTLNCNDGGGGGSSDGSEIGTSPHGGGGGVAGSEFDDVWNSENNPPCPGDPIKNPEICPSSASNSKGGTYGCTRNAFTKCGGVAGKKKHGGVDVACPINQKVYAMYSGTVVSKRDSFENDQYAANSLGNYVEIESVINGEIIRIKYCHLGYVPTLATGLLSQGWPFALTGKSGNAGAKGVTPHIHIQAKKKVGNDWVEIDPLPLFDTNFNPDTQQPTGSKTNCN
jgi:hypothetical protein